MRGKRLYRRGDIIWWRRSIRLSDGRDLLVQLSLRTGDPARARRLGQPLGLSTGGVRRLVEGLTVSHPWLTTTQLQRIARTAFDETMGIFAIHDMANRWPPDGRAKLIEDLLDYFDWVAAHGGGQPVPTPDDHRRFRDAGWSEERVDRLSYNIHRSRDESGDFYSCGSDKLGPMLEELGVSANSMNVRAGMVASVRGKQDALVALQRLGAEPAAAISLLPLSAESLFGVPITRSQCPPAADGPLPPETV